MSLKYRSKWLEQHRRQKKDTDKDYRQFLDQYFGYISTEFFLQRKQRRLTLLLDRQNPYFTFQGFPVADVIFTRDPEKMYPQLNRTLISADFPKYKPHKNFQPFLKELGIKTEKDIVAKMHHWAPTSPLCLTFFNNSDGFLYYKIKVDRHDWIKLSRNFFKWDLNLGVNYLQVRTVSRKKIKGVVTFLKVKYGDPFSKVVK